MAMKKTLLQIVQEIMNDMDSDSVNSISDSVEAEQIASVVESVYYNTIAPRHIPEHQELIKLTAASDNSYPTHFQYGDNVKEVEIVWYQNSDGEYREVYWKDPLEFLYLTDRDNENYDAVLDKNAGTTLRIANDVHPTFYTSFDDNWVIFNSYESSVESSLQQSKVRAWGTVYPVFSQTDNYVPDLDSTLFPYLIAESKSTAMSLFKGGPDPKIEQAARRQKSYIQNDMYKTKRGNKWSNYGRTRKAG